MINGTVSSALIALKWPGAIVGGVVGLAVIMSSFGFGIETPGEVMTDFKSEHAVEHVAIDTALLEIDQHLEVQQTLLEAIVIGDCVDRTKEQLELQRLIPTCKSLGIEKD